MVGWLEKTEVKSLSVYSDDNEKIVKNRHTDGESDSLIPGTFISPKKSGVIEFNRPKSPTQTSQKINIFSSDKSKNVVNSENKDVESGVGDLNVKLKVKSVSKSSVKVNYEAGNSRLQCHLLNSQDKIVSADVPKEPLDKILKRKLSQNMKTKRPKSTTNTPEKSEIMQMFEKLQKKKAENMLKGSQISLKTPMKNTGGVANIPPKNIIDTSTVTIVDQSPKLKPKNMSRFDVLKSIFEPQKLPNLDEKIDPKNVSFVGNTHKYYPPESKSKKNGEISSKIRAFS